MAQGKYIPGEWWKPQLFYVSATVNGSLRFYFFDAVVKAAHTREMVITKHPVQDGANIVDHAYSMPARLELEIVMSDAVVQYQPPASSRMMVGYSSDISKSKSAYQTFLSLQKARTLLQVTTRLDTYNNMLIQSIRPIEEHSTLYALKATIVLEEIIMAYVGTATRMERAFGPTTKGDLATIKPPDPVDAAVQAIVTGVNPADTIIANQLKPIIPTGWQSPDFGEH